MSATLFAKGLAAAHGDRTLFSDLDLTLAPGDVVGVVGANGAGKSTLFRILAGHVPATAGQVVLSPCCLRISPYQATPSGKCRDGVAHHRELDEAPRRARVADGLRLPEELRLGRDRRHPRLAVTVKRAEVSLSTTVTFRAR